MQAGPTTRNRLSAWDRERIIEFYTGGQTKHQIAKYFNISYSGVSCIIEQANNKKEITL
jgi:DNA-directed RNA polymerase specialized sigma subunit